MSNKMPTTRKTLDYEAERDRNRGAGRLVKLVIETRVPSKWRMVDKETGDVWRWDDKESKWTRADDHV